MCLCCVNWFRVKHFIPRRIDTAFDTAAETFTPYKFYLPDYQRIIILHRKSRRD